MPPQLETERLILRPLELTDAGQAQPLFAQWEIVKYLTAQVPWPFPPDGAYCFYRDVALPEMARGEAWHWSIRLKTAPDQLVGCIGLKRGDNVNRGFWVGLPWQGQGIATEACEAVTAYWFDVLKMAVLRVSKAVENGPSRRMSVRTGMRLIELTESEYVSGRLPTEVWEITAAEWRLQRDRR
jgi:RimJ/RimL family protein N-acetyltransferase